MLLEIVDLHVRIKGGQEILKGINLRVGHGESHVIMGRNGSGKSTLGFALMGHPKYQITSGKILFEGKDINLLSADERAKLGIFLSFQYPPEVPGISQSNFLRKAKSEVSGENVPVRQWLNELQTELAELDIDKSFARRDLNVGFSGGEKKRNEILQLKILQPKLAILDEVDSGLDVDAVKVVARELKKGVGKRATVLISHYLTIPKSLGVDHYHIMKDGKIIQEGGVEIAERVALEGFDEPTTNN
jgi:Fe-S cluster assembly ATP-binding protein